MLYDYWCSGGARCFQDSPQAEEEKEEEEVDIDLTDPEVEKAATKIQASFKGFKARKQAQANKVCCGFNNTYHWLLSLPLF